MRRLSPYRIVCSDSESALPQKKTARNKSLGAYSAIAYAEIASSSSLAITWSVGKESLEHLV